MSAAGHEIDRTVRRPSDDRGWLCDVAEVGALVPNFGDSLQQVWRFLFSVLGFGSMSLASSVQVGWAVVLEA